MSKPQSIGQKIRQARKRIGLSQDKLARLADVAYNTIVKIESGENPNPTVETIRKIADALKVEISDIVN